MFSRPLVLIDANAASPTQTTPCRSAPSSLSPDSAAPSPSLGPSSWSPAAAAHELLALTRLFKRLMRAQWRRATTTRNSGSTPPNRAMPMNRSAPAARAMPTGAGFTGSERIPAMLRKSSQARRLSPVQVSESLRCGHLTGPRMHADPVDPQRVVISGSFAEVCAALDQLVIRQGAHSGR